MNHCETEIINVQIEMCRIKIIIDMSPSEINDKHVCKLFIRL